jgi:hypothetical protein
MPFEPKLISPIYKSIIRNVVDLVEEINTLGLVNPPAEYHNWEERVDEQNLPNTTLIGTDGFSFDENNGLWLIRYALAVSSFNDADLLNEINLIDFLQQRMGKNEKVPLRELTAGEQVNELVVTDFRVFPMGQSELRNYRTIGIELNRTGA